MRRLAPDDATERHIAVEAPGFGGKSDSGGNFEGAGHRDPLLAGARLFERRYGAGG